MPNTSSLRREHAELTRRAMRLRQTVSQPEPPEADELVRMRREFSELLVAHLLFEDRDVYPRLFRSPSARVAHMARTFADEMGDQCETFLSYSKAWNDAAVETDWPAFGQATKEILDAVEIRILRENRILYPLLDQHRAPAG